MAEGDDSVEGDQEQVQEVEAPEELNEEEEALLHFGRYAEARQALPWAQKTFREKVSYYLDRLFLVFLVVFLLVLLGEVIYKFWWVTNWKKIVAFVIDILFTQEEEEQLIEL